MIAGDGVWAVGVMWGVTGLTFIFVLLRIYTRLVVVKSYGVDDNVYNLSFICLLIFTSITTLAAPYGFGQDITAITDPTTLRRAILYEAIGMTFGLVAMAGAKWALGLFLLRIVQKRWHRMSIWLAMLLILFGSLASAVVFWLQCSPPKYLWDKSVRGHCRINATASSLVICILCVLVDFFFAMFPWLFIWRLRMNPREKGVILFSMSLGVIAGACGIKRTMETVHLSSPNFPKESVKLVVWSAAEIAVTMVCNSIPICRPLYKRYLDKWVLRRDRRYQVKEVSGAGSGGTDSARKDPFRQRQMSEGESEVGVDQMKTVTENWAIGGLPAMSTMDSGGMHDDNHSESGILGLDDTAHGDYSSSKTLGHEGNEVVAGEKPVG